MQNRVFKAQILLRVVDRFEVIVKDIMCFHENVQDEAFNALSDPMIVTISVHVISTIKQLLNLKSFVLWIADLIINDARPQHNPLMVERAIRNIDLLSVSE